MTTTRLLLTTLAVMLLLLSPIHAADTDESDAEDADDAPPPEGGRPKDPVDFSSLLEKAERDEADARRDLRTLEQQAAATETRLLEPPPDGESPELTKERRDLLNARWQSLKTAIREERVKDEKKLSALSK